jgi:xanthine dehydrogenase accessory factor
MTELTRRINTLLDECRSFAVATVVLRHAPVSSHVADKAIVLEDGTMEGWIGGACSREIVRKNSQDALLSNAPRLVKISPEYMFEESTNDGGSLVVHAPMRCVSEGKVDVYIEPFVAPPIALVAGESPVARALLKLAQFMEFTPVFLAETTAQQSPLHSVQIVTIDALSEFVAALTPARREQIFAIVATMSNYDERALMALHGCKPHYIGLVASRKRAPKVKDTLRSFGWTEDELRALYAPVGLDMNAKSPEEVAVSIMAEIIQVRRHGQPSAQMETRTSSSTVILSPDSIAPMQAPTTFPHAASATTHSFKTNINCGSCVASVTPHLNALVGEGAWHVDTTNPDKILTLPASTSFDAVKETLNKAGFQAVEL